MVVEVVEVEVVGVEVVVTTMFQVVPANSPCCIVRLHLVSSLWKKNDQRGTTTIIVRHHH